MIVEVSGDDLLQPFSLTRNWLMHSPSQFLFDDVQLCSHTLGPGFPFNLEFAPARRAADESEAQEVECLRLAEPFPLAVICRKATELDQPRLLRVERQRELL